ncbi:MAG: hypothetical protein Q8Q15_03240 [bacterium]|nr:hypothetical protein [bacterium]
MTCSRLETKSCEVSIPIPSKAKVLVEKGEKVVRGEALAKCEETFQEFNLTKILKISPQNVVGCLLVTPGTPVKQGQILAQKKSFLDKRVFKSPVSGLVVELAPEGFLKIRVAEMEQTTSPVKAEVREVKDNDIILEFTANILTGAFGSGKRNWGQIEILKSKDEAGLEDLPNEVKDKIFITRGKISAGFVHKAEALDAAGVVGGNIDGQIKTADLALITLGEDLISDDIWDTLKKSDKQTAVISGDEKVLNIPIE